ncbi:MAG TPA: (d)CMP kinase [Hyphomicrobiales bacterium]|nr:(d)CMP kinase [Kaistiaceae bacterium]HQF31920.1 (d)CMP kinase [Hyphomicrobiales bacterium]
MIIAIDGPAASGKGTLARRLAAHYGLNHLDTGLLYRAVGRAMLDKGLDPANAEAATAAAEALDLAGLGSDPRLREEAAGEAASVVAAIPSVRAALLEQQRRFAATAPGAVLDGRDIGTVVCPNADVKLFVSASPEERARRRTDELAGKGEPADYGTILADIRQRDERDMKRSVAPLAPASDAFYLDTSMLGIEEVFARARAHVDLACG